MIKAEPKLNHSAAHVLAAAVLKLYPETKVAIGPPIDEGFYYDFDFKEPISENDLSKIEKQMKKIISGGYTIDKVAKVDLSDNPYKKELIDQFTKEGREITYYGMINPANKENVFVDLCKGGHIKKISEIKHFKLLSLAGAYWRGDSKNKQLTRIYGTAWRTKEELDKYLKIREERKERDHRKIGKEMNIFTFQPLAGQGFPIWLENGMVIKKEIQKFIRDIEFKYGFREVETPALGEKKLYEISGHLAHYQEDMFPVIELENESLIMRPMTCPHHVLLYKATRRSYRDLPIRMSEQSRLYRYEPSGALTGLERVRSMLLTEGHVFARKDQIEEEFKNSYKLIAETLKKFDIEVDYISLSLRDKEDKEKYYDDDAMWNEAEERLRNVLKELKVDYKEIEGEAAFYGPKIDIQVKTALGHDITLSTLQLDFLLPERFELSYINSKEEKERPVMIHRGLIGTYERFVAILLEQTKGNLPFWLAPRQVTIIPVNNKSHLKHAENVERELLEKGIRVMLDKREERVGKKIREAQTSKTKYQIVIGDDEVSKDNITVRAYGKKDQKTMKLSAFIKGLSK